MQRNKALRRLTHVEELLSDVMERYSDGSPDIKQQLLHAKALVGRATDAMKAQASTGKKSTRKKAVTKKTGVKALPAKATKKDGPTRKDYEG